MEIKSNLKYFLRFTILLISITSITIYYFDNFLIGDYIDGFNIISQNLIEDRNRFYNFISLEYIKIDIFLLIFVFLFLIFLYSSKFYSYVNELTFTIDKSIFDEYINIFLLWSASILSFLQLFRFTAISRAYLILFLFFVPFLLVVFRNSELISSLLGRNVKTENYITINLEENSIFHELRLLKLRSNIGNYKINNFEISSVTNLVDSINKKNKLNLIVFYLNAEELSPEIEKYLLNLNKKVLLISSKNLDFKNNFYFRLNQTNKKYLYYINNDIQYGSRYILKRVIDITLSIMFLFIASPIILLIIVLILIKSGRPIIYSQTRVGLHGNNFQMYKFRTMKVDSHSKREDLKEQNIKSGPLFKIENDPRIIKGLQFLRSYSLDEIPQFLNVLNGSMSIVGPRPLFPEDNEHYDTIYMRRLNVLPGITGLLQINDRNTNDFKIWYKFDIEYIDSWSLWNDFKIILKTPISIFTRKIKGK